MFRAPSFRLFSGERVGILDSQPACSSAEHLDPHGALRLKSTCPNAPKCSVPHPFAFFLAKGWESSTLNQPVHRESGKKDLGPRRRSQDHNSNLLLSYFPQGSAKPINELLAERIAFLRIVEGDNTDVVRGFHIYIANSVSMFRFLHCSASAGAPQKNGPNRQALLASDDFTRGRALLASFPCST
jgi:hypothetical protein